MKRFKMSFTRAPESPTKDDRGSFGALWESNEDYTKLFIQVSEDESYPRWTRMGNFLEKALNDLVQDEQFITMALSMYLEKKRYKK